MDIRDFFGAKKKKVVQKSSKKKNEEVPKGEEGDNVDGGDAESEQKPPSKLKKGKLVKQKNESNKHKRVDVTTESFFANSKKQKANSKAKKKPRKSVIAIAESDSETEGEEDSPEFQLPNKKPRLSAVSQTSGEIKKPPSPSKKSPRKRTRIEETRDDGDDDDEDFKLASDNDDDDDDAYLPEQKPKKKLPPSKRQKTPTPKKLESPKASPSKKRTVAKRKPAIKKEALIEPGESLDSFDVASAPNEFLQGLTFVFSGVLDTLSRGDSIEFVKVLGARVTGQVSSKTDYLVVGEMLEDGRHHTEGSKYKKATEHSVLIVRGEKQLYGLCHAISRKKKEGGANSVKVAPAAKSAAVVGGSGPKKPNVANPYARKSTASNPYAKASNSSTKAGGSSASKDNPYANSNNPYATNPAAGAPTQSAALAKTNDPTALWADKYAPSSTRDILGNRDIVNKLESWLKNWERQFNNEDSRNKTFSAPGGPKKAALLSGPPGIGKTTTATLVAQEAGRDTLEMNASDVRSKKALAEGLGDVTGSQVLNFSGSPTAKKRCIIMDEVDGMGAGDRSGMVELIKMIKESRVPIICICNDRQSQKIKSLVPYCLDLKYRRPVKSVIARRAVRVGEAEGMMIEQNAAEAITESCGNDVRQVLNCLQMWASDKGNKMTYKDLKERENSINKDEMLRVNIFEACKMIVEGRKGLSGSNPREERASLYKRSDAFFVDYSLMGLNVHQNYLKVMARQFGEAKRSNDDRSMESFLDRMHEATMSMSDFAVAEEGVRGGDQNWSLLPFCGMMTVKAGFHGAGEHGSFMPGFPEFTSWMGKNSTRGKKVRLLQELAHHMNYKISCDNTELRLNYLPVVRDRFQGLLDSKCPQTTEAIALMDEYGLDRDDVFENLDEFKMNPKDKKISDLDSKQKAAFTREYNKGSHTSQALVAEQGVAKKPRKRKGSKEQDPVDPDTVNDDMVEESESEDDEEDDTEQLKELFKKSGKSKSRSSSSKGKKRKSK